MNRLIITAIVSAVTYSVAMSASLYAINKLSRRKQC